MTIAKRMLPDIEREIAEISSDREHGATELARRAARLFASLSTGELKVAAARIAGAQPSMAPLVNLANAAIEGGPGACRLFLDRLDRSTSRIAALARPLLSRKTVLTHSASETVEAAIKEARPELVIATESLPGGEGRGLAERLRSAGLQVRLVTDAESLGVSAEADAIVAGADSIGPGGVVNKIGTLALARAARESGKPFYVLAATAKQTAHDLETGELFDRTPLDLITAIVSEEGVYSPGR